MNKYYLGIFGGQGPNPAAALLKNNKLVAFAEEERFVRIKNATSFLPIYSIKFCLEDILKLILFSIIFISIFLLIKLRFLFLLI